MAQKKDIVLVDEPPTLRKIKAVSLLVAQGAIAFETVVPQSLLTLLVGGAVVYLWVTGKPVPDGLLGVFFTLVGFYFGSDYEYRRLKGKVDQNG
jgi:hypothetical protein